VIEIGRESVCQISSQSIAPRSEYQTPTKLVLDTGDVVLDCGYVHSGVAAVVGKSLVLINALIQRYGLL
jgi:hypothetical protein